MKMSSWLLAFALSCSPLVAAEFGFKNALPDEIEWVFEGDEKPVLMDDGTVKVMDFNDSLETAAISLTHTIEPVMADDMKEKGFELKMRLKSDLDVPESGNTMVVDVRLKDYAPMALVFWHSPGWKSLGISSYDIVAEKYFGTELKDGNDRYIDVTARYVPESSDRAAGKWMVEVDSTENVFESAVALQQGSGQDVVQISSNHNDKLQKSRWLIESFKITVP